jgi:effector-binding domain-containing protein
MKIIKYIFLLILLALVGISVYVATQKGDYSIKRSTFIKVPKEVVFNYLNDYRNWDQWLDLSADSSAVQFDFPENTIGQGGSFSWINGDEKGKIQTLFVKENDSIAQKISIDETISQSSLTLKDSIGGTKLNWTVTGTADFTTKIKAAFTENIASLKGKMYQNSLNNVTAIITKEIRNFSVEVIGAVKIDSVYYVKQTATVKLRDMNSKITPMLQKMDKFFKNGNLKMNGKPFVIYESSDRANGTITFSVCGPLKQEIFVSDPSDVSIAKLQPFTALKTVLKGDYSHRDAAIKKALKYLSEKKIDRNSALNYIDIYTVNASDQKSPSKWITEVLIPIQQKDAAAPRVYVTPPTTPVKDLIVE